MEDLQLGLCHLLCPGVQGREQVPKQLDLISVCSLLILRNRPPRSPFPPVRPSSSQMPSVSSRGTEKLGNFANNTQLVDGRVGIQSQAI